MAPALSGGPGTALLRLRPAGGLRPERPDPGLAGSIGRIASRPEPPFALCPMLALGRADPPVRVTVECRAKVTRLADFLNLVGRSCQAIPTQMPSISDLYLTFAAIRAKDWCADKVPFRCDCADVRFGDGEYVRAEYADNSRIVFFYHLEDPADARFIASLDEKSLRDWINETWIGG